MIIDHINILVLYKYIMINFRPKIQKLNIKCNHFLKRQKLPNLSQEEQYMQNYPRYLNYPMSLTTETEF